MSDHPSYSLMYSFREGFSIIIYSCTHNTNLFPEICLHQNTKVRLILPEWMVVSWDKSLYNCEAKSGETPRHQNDMRFFHICGQLLTQSQEIDVKLRLMV